MRRDVQKVHKMHKCLCAEYGYKQQVVWLFGQEYCARCQLPDKMEWWDKITPSERTAFMIWRDLRSRQGSDIEIDPEIKSELLEKWASIIWDPKEQGRPIPHTLLRWLDNMPDEQDIALAREQLLKLGMQTIIERLNEQAVKLTD